MLISMLKNLTFCLMRWGAGGGIEENSYFCLLPYIWGAKILFYVLFLVTEVGRWFRKLLKMITNLTSSKKVVGG